jgi:transcriptional regulator with XRE-family HTH domain
MVATDNRFVINRKIEDIILKKGLSSSHFADDINVPRSSISHILANRNKPSLEIIHKIIKKYPDISFDWLMDGIENSSESMPQEQQPSQIDSRYKRVIKPELGFDVRNNTETNTMRTNAERYKSRVEAKVFDDALPNNITPAEGKSVVRVMLFYSDNTAETFKII